MSAIQSSPPIRTAQAKVDPSLTQADQRRLFEALDLLQEQRAQSQVLTNSALDAATREDEMFQSLSQLRIARGEVVNEQEIRAAIRATREPTNLVYERTPDGLARSLANAYLARNKWFPHTMVALSLAMLLWGGVSWREHAVQQAFEEYVASNTRNLSQMQSSRQMFDDIQNDWPQGTGQAVHLAAFENALAVSDEALRAASANLASPTRESVSKAAAAIARSNSALNDARSAQVASQTQATLVDRAAEVAELPIDESWPEANVRRKTHIDDLQLALAAGDLARAQSSLEAISALSNASALRSTLREAAGLVPPVGQEEAQALRARGEAALLNADTASANQSIAALRTLTDTIASSYTMKIVNENGVKSGVWRYPNNNPNARNYYIVVDALDSSGNPVDVSVVNEETGNTEIASRFAVRVTDEVYESVKDDKLDNGLIDKPLIGTKSPGKLRPEYAVDTANGGIITNW